MVTRKKGFSLIELSIVIVIIGILIVGIVGSKHLIAKSRITNAQSMTRSSIINGTLNNKLWLETSLSDISLGEGLETGDAITSWIDNSSNKTSISISAVGSGAEYANSINYVQAVKFGESSDENHLQIDNASFLNGTNYTIFITEKRIGTNGSTGNYLLGGAADSFAVGYESGNSIIQTHGEAADSDNQASIEALSSYSNKPRVITFTHSSTDGNKIYINGTLANEDNTSTAQAHLSGITTLAIGNNYNGEIGEIVIFDRDLKTVERRDIEDYLTDKWEAPNNRDLSASCTTGTVTSTGCESSCSAPTINGTTTSITSDGETAEFTCNATGYASNILTYTCSSGSLSPTPSASDCADVGCGSGYNEDGGECKAKCTITAQTGLASNTAVDSGSTSLSCDSGYTGSITYTCDNGTASSITNNCVVPVTCDLDAEAIPGVTQTGTVDQVVGGTLTCDGTGYDGQTITYDCNSSGVFENVGTCNCGAPLYLSDGGGNCVSSSALIWFDASDTSTITHSSNSVSQWNDKSGNALHVTQETSSYQPTTGSNTINGLNVLAFNGDMLSGSTIIGSSSNFTFFVVAHVTNIGSANRMLITQYLNGDSDRTVFMIIAGNTGNYGYFKAAWRLSGVALSDANDYLLYSARDGDNITLEVDSVGSTAAPFGSFTVSQRPFTIGAGGGLIGGFVGDIGEIIGFNKTLTSSEKAQIESYLNNKWGL